MAFVYRANRPLHSDHKKNHRETEITSVRMCVWPIPDNCDEGGGGPSKNKHARAIETCRIVTAKCPSSSCPYSILRPTRNATHCPFQSRHTIRRLRLQGILISLHDSLHAANVMDTHAACAHTRCANVHCTLWTSPNQATAASSTYYADPVRKACVRFAFLRW